MIERQEIPDKVKCIVSGGDIGMKHAARRRVLHHKVYRTSDAVAFKVGHHGLIHLYAVQNLGGKQVEGHETVLVVGTRNLHPVHQSVVISFVHASENGILPLARRITLGGDSRHLLDDVADCNIRRKFHGACAHHIDHIHGISLYHTCARIGVRGGSGNHHFTQLCCRFRHTDGERGVSRIGYSL